MKWLFLVLGLVILVVAVVIAIGAMLPKQHSASRTARLKAPPEEVWRVITDVNSFPSWRDVKRVEILPPRNGHRVWREIDRHNQTITLEAEEEIPPRRLVTRIADRNLPFGGTWTWDVASVGEGSDLTITENGEIYNPIFRFVARYILGYHATIDATLKALASRWP